MFAPNLKNRRPEKVIHTVSVHADAPPKPAEGEPCNGCGICCSAGHCPVAWLFLPLGGGTCPALEWNGQAGRYYCGMVVDPAHHVRWLPQRWERRASQWFARRIAADRACDCGITEVRDT
jgi:hypothetical protein